MTHLKAYGTIMFNNLLLFIPQLTEVNEVIKSVSGIAGLILIFYTIKKIRADLKAKK